MLDFVCPSCHARCQIADSYAGKSVLCLECGKSATIPPRDESKTAVTTPDLADAALQAKAHRHDVAIERGIISVAKDGGAARRWIELCVLGIGGVAVLVVVAALVLPTTVQVRDTGWRWQSVNNLKQIVLAMHNYHDAYKKLPTNGTVPAKAKDGTSGSWAFQILPYLDEQPAFENPQASQKDSISTFMCPGRARSTDVKTGPVIDYFLNIYVNTKTIGNGWNAADANVKLDDITDGTSNTVFAGQGWISSNDYTKTVIPGQSNSIFLGGVADLARGGTDVPARGNAPQAMFQPDSDPLPAGAALIPWGGPAKQGALMGMGDGTVRVFPYTTQNFGAFLTPTNGEPVELPDT